MSTSKRLTYLLIQNLEMVINKFDYIIDCSDNFNTRHEINKLCFINKKKLIFGSAIKFDGQVAYLILPKYPIAVIAVYSHSSFEDENCSTMGIFSPVVGIIGCLQAMEILKLIISNRSSLTNKIYCSMQIHPNLKFMN